MNQEGKTCKDCGTLLGPGRDDKQFCNDACRTNYNNRQRKARRVTANVNLHQLNQKTEPAIPEYIERIQQILVNNRRILSQICDEERPGRIRERDLIGKGFNTKYFTSETEEPDSHYRFCFEYGYRKEDDDKYLVICRKREVL